MRACIRNVENRMEGCSLPASRRSLNGVRCGRSSWVDRAGVGGDWKDGCRVESGGEDD